MTMRYICLTNIGAYLFASGSLVDRQSEVVQWILSQETTPEYSDDTMKFLSSETHSDNVMTILRSLVKRKAILLSRQPETCPDTPMQEVLPQMLSVLSDSGKAMLVDSQGLSIASVGVDAERIEALSALASKLAASLYHGDSDVFDLLDIEYGLTCLYDIVNKKIFTFVPIMLGSNRLVVVTEGKSVFSGKTFKDFIWVLWNRYSEFKANFQP